MLIRNRNTFTIGALLSISFLVVLLLIFSPIFKGQNGLQFADDSFNKLAKGSSYFIPKVAEDAKGMNGKSFTASLSYDSAADAQAAASILSASGAKADVSDTKVAVSGDLGAVLASALTDADAMYANNGAAVSSRYSMDEKKAMKLWWTTFLKTEKFFKKAKLIEEAKAVSAVNKKAVEPAYNFYQVDANNVQDHAGMMTGLLVFYVAYTMWWGYSIFYAFDGLGLTMKKAKVRKEV